MRRSLLRLSVQQYRKLCCAASPTTSAIRCAQCFRYQQSRPNIIRASYYSTERQPVNEHGSRCTVNSEDRENAEASGESIAGDVPHAVPWGHYTPSLGSLIVPEGEPDFAFAFDIDGVLLRSGKTLRGARRGLEYLLEHNIPFILLTNGGGKHESDRVKQLSVSLQVPLTEKNFVQSHTPFRALVEGSGKQDALKDKTVLVTGSNGDQCRYIAQRYGFKKVVTPGDILKAHPTIWPFSQVKTQVTDHSLPAQANTNGSSENVKIDAILVLNDPRDWAVDIQVIMDLLLSQEGFLGTYSHKNGDNTLPNRGWQQDAQPKLYFSNSDLLWATDYDLPRFGQGAFQAALQGVWNATTGNAKLRKTVIGKPHAYTYEYAEKVLYKHRAQILCDKGMSIHHQKRIAKVYMVGDNPESDIRGANEFKSPLGTEWESILLKTGVYKDGTVPAYTPNVIVDDVMGAILWALQQQGYKSKPRSSDPDAVTTNGGLAER